LRDGGAAQHLSMVNASITDWIAERASELGFAMSGVVRAERFPELERNEEWLARGYAGEMKYLEDARRGDPQKAMPGAHSAIVCALNYNTQYPRTAQAAALLDGEALDEPRGWISRYAWGDDYHEVLRTKLEDLVAGLREQYAEPFEARIYADTGPLNERVLSKHAGLGWLGKNTLLLNEQIGSFFFLGGILTTLDLRPSLGSADFPGADRCGSCRKCIEACPTGALVDAYVMDARRCISYLTIELREPIPEELREPMGQHVFGCDICQDVCPWNRNAPVTQAMEFQPRRYRKHSEAKATEPGVLDLSDASDEEHESLFLPRMEWLASINEQEFREMFAGSPIKRTKWKGLMRNACIALGNSNIARDSAAGERVLEVLARLGACGEAMVAESAQWAVSRIQGNERVSEHL
jgi:epoxyqueuosine reductase